MPVLLQGALQCGSVGRGIWFRLFFRLLLLVAYFDASVGPRRFAKLGLGCVFLPVAGVLDRLHRIACDIGERET